ncbi:hypothetical protein B0H14DRAFT_3880045 [Mycena olivaceomarginata]|nr:hypothetical protein B0H14DRAFT_3880045 [Mycena olivaceomarginata]
MHVTTNNEESSRATTISPSTASGMPAIGKVGRVAGPLARCQPKLSSTSSRAACDRGLAWCICKTRNIRFWSTKGVKSGPFTARRLTHTPPPPPQRRHASHSLRVPRPRRAPPHRRPPPAPARLRAHPRGAGRVWGRKATTTWGRRTRLSFTFAASCKRTVLKASGVPPVGTLSAGAHGQTIVNAANSPPRGRAEGTGEWAGRRAGCG